MRRLFFLILLLGIVAGIFRYYYWHHPQQKQADFITLYGNVDIRQVDLGFRANGRVISMPFQEGDWIQEGMLIAELDPQPYIDQLTQSQASMEALKTSLIYAEQVFKRREALRSLNDGSISEEDYENALSNKETLLANIKQAEATVELAKTNLKDTKIYAPSNGVILTRIREPGTVVREADPVYTLSLHSPIWVRAFVPEPYLGLIYPSMKAEIFTDTEESKPYQGHIGFISPVAEFTPKTVETTQLRTDLVYRLRIIADNPDNGLRQGMPVTIKLSLKNEMSLEPHGIISTQRR